MTKYARWILFAAMVLAQLGVPAWMIAGSESALSGGARYQFRTAPVDPEDAFRGKYVALAFKQNSCEVDSGVMLRRGMKVYAVIGQDSSGFACVTGIARKKPAGGDFVRVTVEWQNGTSIRFRYPFDRYFMEEGKAPEAERLYREHSRVDEQGTYAVVRVKDGRAVIEDLVIGGAPVREAVRSGRSR
jgi:uncharacterized membrane-anchored protein